MCATVNYSDIGIVHTDSSNVLSLVENSVDIRCDNTDSKIAVCDSAECASSEWPAVIVPITAHSVQVQGGGPDSPLLSVIQSTCLLLCFYIPTSGTRAYGRDRTSLSQLKC